MKQVGVIVRQGQTLRTPELLKFTAILAACRGAVPLYHNLLHNSIFATNVRGIGAERTDIWMVQARLVASGRALPIALTASPSDEQECSCSYTVCPDIRFGGSRHIATNQLQYSFRLSRRVRSSLLRRTRLTPLEVHCASLTASASGAMASLSLFVADTVRCNFSPAGALRHCMHNLSAEICCFIFAA